MYRAPCGERKKSCQARGVPRSVKAASVVHSVTGDGAVVARGLPGQHAQGGSVCTRGLSLAFLSHSLFDFFLFLTATLNTAVGEPSRYGITGGVRSYV